VSLSDLAALGSFISGLAVLISLIFLYFQLRQVNAQVQQAERNQQASIRQGRMAVSVDMSLAQMEPSAAEAILKGLSGADDISDTQFAQFNSYCRAVFYVGEDAFYQHSEGGLNETAFGVFVGRMSASFALPSFRLAWKTVRGIHGVGGSCRPSDRSVSQVEN
jgi:hypothetical protein